MKGRVSKWHEYDRKLYGSKPNLFHDGVNNICFGCSSCLLISLSFCCPIGGSKTSLVMVAGFLSQQI